MCKLLISIAHHHDSTDEWIRKFIKALAPGQCPYVSFEMMTILSV